MPDLYALTEQTAARLKQLLGDRGGEPAGHQRGPRGRTVTLVRCTSAAAAGGSGAAAISYPAIVVIDGADDTSPAEYGECWLTLWDDDGVAGVPTDGRLYLAVLSGSLTVGTDSRPRAFAVMPPAGGGSSPLTMKGDLWGFSTLDARFPVGTNGYVVVADSAEALGVRWGAVTVVDGDYGDITVSKSGTVWMIDNDAVTDPKLRDSAGLSVIGRGANSTGDPADIVAGSDYYCLRRDGTALAFGLLSIQGGGTGKATQTAGFDALAPTAKAGDLSVHDGSNNVRLAIGTDDYVLTANSKTAEGMSWQAKTSGTVTSVAASGPSGVVTWSSAVTTAGTLTATLDKQTANYILAGPTSGSAAVPAFRAAVVADLPLFSGFTNATPASADRFPFYDDSGAVNADCSFAELVAAIGAVTGPSPGVPTSLTVGTVGDQSVALSWTAPTGVPPASTYNVYRATNSGMSTGLTTLVTGQSGTTYTNNTANGNAPTNGTTYYYAVIAVTSTGGTSGYSNVVSATPEAAYLLDTFSGSSIILVSHLMDIGPGGVPNSAGWAELTGAWTVDGSGLVATDGTTDPAYAVADAGYADCTVTATFTTSSDAGQGGMGVFVRATDEDNGWLFDFNQFNFYLFEVNAGTYTARDHIASPAGGGTSTTFTITVTLSGNSLSGTIGSNTVSYSSSFNNTATKHGLKTDNDTGQTFTIFQVSP